jgi:dTDP-4-dehydrorhamnose reductase
MKILVLGDGLLGSEIVKQTGCDFISRKATGFNIDNLDIIDINYDVIVNCIANTDTYSDDKEGHWNVNYKFVDKLIDFCNDASVKLVQISTDYLYANSNVNAVEDTDVPVHGNNWYSYTKLLADGLIQLKSKDYLLCRTSFKPTPFPYENAWIDQLNNADYVDIIANYIILLINKNSEGVFNVGGEFTTPYSLALITNPNVGKIKRPNDVPMNTTMNINKMKNEFRKMD